MAGSSFFREFLKDRKMVGSIIPSSAALVKQLIKPINFEDAKCIVELGPGNGCVTREILKRMRPDAKLLTFELNKPFCDKLESWGDQRMIVIHDSAHKIEEYLAKYGYTKADYIVSSLPLTNIPGKIKINIINGVVQTLKPGGTFTQFQYYKTAEKLLRKKFKRVSIRFTPLNIPPAFVYICQLG